MGQGVKPVKTVVFCSQLFENIGSLVANSCLTVCSGKPGYVTDATGKRARRKIVGEAGANLL